MKIAIIGAGSVGRALGSSWQKLKHEVTYVVRNPEDPKHADLSVGARVVREGAISPDVEVIVLATPWTSTEAAARQIAHLKGKVVIDATNALKSDLSGILFGHTDSAGEHVQRWLKDLHVVKAFNTIGANIMENPKFGLDKAVLYIAGNHAPAKEIVLKLASDIGFEALDMGPIEAARFTEVLAMTWILTAYRLGKGREIAFALKKR
jgi:predicted dinucleotide-binding enzyme